MVFLLPDAVSGTAQAAPERQAIVCRKESLTYGQLEQRTNQLARILVDQGVRRGDRVGIFLDKSIESAVALYGIMKADAAYVPLDVTAPPARLDYVIKHCGIRHLVTAPNKRRALVQLLATPDCPIESLLGAPAIEGIRARHVTWKDISLTSSATIDSGCLDQDLAYIMYTSGSTGEPKGIIHTHASGLSYAKWAHDVYSLRPEDRLTNHAPLHFDLSSFDFFASALAGATTVIVGGEYLKLPASYSQLLADEKITTFFTVPYTLTQLLTRGALDQRDLTALRWIIFGGEPFPMKHLVSLMAALPQARFSNMYGPTEVNGCTYYHVPRPLEDEETPIPIGKTWRNADALIVDADDRILADNKPGELLILSSTMMQGYWNRPDLNKLAFTKLAGTEEHPHYYYCTGDLVERRPDGTLKFLGRKDRQIKTRGYRVELDEVEASVIKLGPVEEAAAFAVPDGEGSHAIHVAVILTPEANQGTSIDLLNALKETLPWYCVPQKLTTEAYHGVYPSTHHQWQDRPPRFANASHPGLTKFMSDHRPLILDFILHELLNGEQADELEFDTNLLVSGLVDSLGLVRLLAHLQEQLSITIPPEDVTIENFISIDVMEPYLNTRTSA